MPENPYSPPTVDDSIDVPATGEPESFGEIARATFLAWEKLRLLYIAILTAFTLFLGMLNFRAFISVEFWFTAVTGAVVANVCYFAGPIVEAYVIWLGFRVASLRLVLFVLGTCFACALALVAITAVFLPVLH